VEGWRTDPEVESWQEAMMAGAAKPTHGEFFSYRETAEFADNAYEYGCSDRTGQALGGSSGVGE
jgi:hypothetical protein